MISKDFKNLRQKVYQANMNLYQSNLVTSTFGNVSGRDPKSGVVAIKPSGMSYLRMKPTNIVLLDMEGNKIEEEALNPSSDTKTHLELYRSFPDIGGVTHSHSTYATVFAQAKLPIPFLGTTHADYFWGEVPVSKVITNRCIRSDYELEAGKLIVDTFKSIDYHHVRACLVACHGPFSWGRDAGESVEIAVALENIARLAYYSLTLNSSIKNIKKPLLDKHYLRKHGEAAYYGQ